MNIWIYDIDVMRDDHSVSRSPKFNSVDNVHVIAPASASIVELVKWCIKPSGTIVYYLPRLDGINRFAATANFLIDGPCNTAVPTVDLTHSLQPCSRLRVTTRYLMHLLRTFKANVFSVSDAHLAYCVSSTNVELYRPTIVNTVNKILDVCVERKILAAAGTLPAMFFFKKWVLDQYEDELVDKMAEETGHNNV